MNVEFTDTAWEDLQFWIENDRKIVNKIIALINDLKRDPVQGLGKPEKLRFGLKVYWSRRITQEHRLVYKLVNESNEANRCIIVQCRYHYTKK